MRGRARRLVDLRWLGSAGERVSGVGALAAVVVVVVIEVRAIRDRKRERIANQRRAALFVAVSRKAERFQGYWRPVTVVRNSSEHLIEEVVIPVEAAGDTPEMQEGVLAILPGKSWSTRMSSQGAISVTFLTPDGSRWFMRPDAPPELLTDG